jgi:ankyrin repeat protein
VLCLKVVPCKDGKTAAFVASFKGKFGLLSWLASKGLDLLSQDDNANTCLHFCGTIQVAEVLLQAGVSVNSKNHQGNTPLHSAYAFHPEVVDFLISNGAANPNVRNNANMKPSDCTSQSTGSRIEVSYDTHTHKQTCGLLIK